MRYLVFTTKRVVPAAALHAPSARFELCHYDSLASWQLQLHAHMAGEHHHATLTSCVCRTCTLRRAAS